MSHDDVDESVDPDDLLEKLNFQQTIGCVAEHWKRRALRAEHLLARLADEALTT